MKTKKRWWPKENQRCYLIDCEGIIRKIDWDSAYQSHKWRADFLGVYRSRRGATLMRNKVLALVEKELGK